VNLAGVVRLRRNLLFSSNLFSGSLRLVSNQAAENVMNMIMSRGIERKALVKGDGGKSLSRLSQESVRFPAADGLRQIKAGRLSRESGKPAGRVLAPTYSAPIRTGC